MHRDALLTETTTVLVFGDGRMPETLVTCFQFRIAADQSVNGAVAESHLRQLRLHVAQAACRPCRGYLIGRLLERRLQGE